MKKIFLTALLLGAASMTPAMARTEFRQISFDEALKAATDENKLVFVDFYTQWCGPCKRMASKVFPTKEVGDFLNAKFVCLQVDAENGEGPQLAEKYGVNAYPTFAVIGSDGNAISSFAGYMEGADFIAKVENLCDPEMAPERVAERYESGERNGKIVQAYAQNIIDNSRNYMAGLEKASAIADEYYSTLTDAQRLMPENNFIFSSYTTELSSPRGAFLAAHINDFAESDSERMKEVLHSLSKSEAVRYFTSNLLADKANQHQYDKYRAHLKNFGWESEFAAMLNFAEKHSTMSDSDFVDFCDSHMQSLSDDERFILLSSLKSTFNPGTPEEITKVSSLARKYIGQMSATEIIFVAQTIYELEKPAL